MMKAPQIPARLWAARRRAGTRVFLATIAFSLFSIARSATMLVAYLLALVSFAALLYVHHVGQSPRVSGLIDLVGADVAAAPGIPGAWERAQKSIEQARRPAPKIS